MTKGSGEVLLSARGLTHHFPSRGMRRDWGKGPVQALRGVNFDVKEGECLAVVGESGSGKTTLARSLLRLVRPTGGEVLFRGVDVLTMTSDELLAFRRKVQIVFQDPFGSLNPRLRAGPMLEEILHVHGDSASLGTRRERVAELLRLVGLHPSHADRYPHEFSGGQRQRLGIARALSVEPELLILDEPVSALDLSIQAQILNLLRDLQERLSLTTILVAHDLTVVRQVADRVAVMYGGKIVEMSRVEALFETPAHPYTRGLLAAVDPGGSLTHGAGRWEILPGEGPSPVRPPGGCSFHPRCPHPEKDQECIDESPELGGMPSGREVACWKEIQGADGA
ncbi:MAG: oligopeptide/dipeptide ABC transporter ATP-binding protein [Gemmatimonadota bacterium]